MHRPCPDLRHLIVLLLVSLGAATVTAAERNIVLIITDDQSPTLGCYGDPAAVTPSLDALAKDGARFVNAYATTASCSASRSAVLSGLHNHKTGQYGHTHHFHKFASFPDVAALALPRVLANEGYRTARIGKYHVAPEAVYRFASVLKADERNPVRMADACRPFITADDARPFFLYFATSDPHRGGGNDASFPGPLKPDLFGNKPGRAAHAGVQETFFDPALLPIPPFLPDSAECRAELAQYYQSQARIDQGIGRLIAILREAGVYERTLIVFTSDHGMAFPGGKTTVYEGGLKVPLIVRNPYEPNRGVVSQALLSHVDITPSLLDFAGGLDAADNSPRRWVDPRTIWADADAPGRENPNGGNTYRTYQGRSWLSCLGKTDDPTRSEIHASHTFHEIQMYYPMRALRDRSYKLIWNLAHPLPYPFASDLWSSATWQAQYAQGMDAPFGHRTVGTYVHRPAFELYHLASDPDERHNLADDPAHAEVLKTYQRRLRAFQETMEDPWITKWDYE
jgi:N-sulfoglucosamine sulfohydrolase